VTSNRRIDFGGDPDHDADPGILTAFYHSVSEPIVTTFAISCLAGVQSLNVYSSF